MTRKSFNSAEGDDARRGLLDRRCERNHPKRHGTQKRCKAEARKKRAKSLRKIEIRRKEDHKRIDLVRKYWKGETDSHP